MNYRYWCALVSMAGIVRSLADKEEKKLAAKAEKYEAGQKVSMMCSGCDTETPHTIETVTKLGKISKAQCDTCETVSTFNRGVKTSVAGGRTKEASPYDRTRKYRKGQAMNHFKFGHGEVTAVLETQKIDVLFGDTTRRLIHAQDAKV